MSAFWIDSPHGITERDLRELTKSQAVIVGADFQRLKYWVCEYNKFNKSFTFRTPAYAGEFYCRWLHAVGFFAELRPIDSDWCDVFVGHQSVDALG